MRQSGIVTGHKLHKDHTPGEDEDARRSRDYPLADQGPAASAVSQHSSLVHDVFESRLAE